MSHTHAPHQEKTGHPLTTQELIKGVESGAVELEQLFPTRRDRLSDLAGQGLIARGGIFNRRAYNTATFETDNGRHLNAQYRPNRGIVEATVTIRDGHARSRYDNPEIPTVIRLTHRDNEPLLWTISDRGGMASNDRATQEAARKAGSVLPPQRAFDLMQEAIGTLRDSGLAPQ